MNRKEVVLTALVLMLLVSVVCFAFQLRSVEVIAEEGFLDLYEPWHVSGTLKLDWNVYPWHTVRFWDCSGFVIDANNTMLDLNGHRVEYKQTVIGPGPIGVQITGKSEVTIKNGTTVDFQYCIWVEDSSEVTILYNNVSRSGKNGIWIRNSREVDVAFNQASQAGDVAIGMDSNSEKVTVANNIVSGNSREGIYLKDSSKCYVIGNTVSRNGYYGIYMYNFNNNTITNNSTINNTPRGGIYMEKSHYNTVSNNTLSDNPRGMELKGSLTTSSTITTS